MQSEMCLLKVPLADFNLYNALTITAVFPCSGPNSGPRVVQIFSSQGAVRYAFWMSLAFTSSRSNQQWLVQFAQYHMKQCSCMS